jgi:hypothetical protein
VNEPADGVAATICFWLVAWVGDADTAETTTATAVAASVLKCGIRNEALDSGSILAAVSYKTGRV